jgi:hypothetical protein
MPYQFEREPLLPGEATRLDLSQCCICGSLGYVLLLSSTVNKENDDGGVLQGGAFPHREHAHRRALVCGLSAEHAPHRRTHAGARRLRRSCPRHPLGRDV